jgi:hypothetical protein
MDRRSFIGGCATLLSLSGCLERFGGGTSTPTTRRPTETYEPWQRVPENAPAPTTQTTVTTEAQTSATEGPPPDFRISVSAPEKVQLDQSFPVKVTVRNVGSGTGTYESPIAVRRSKQASWERLDQTMTATLAGGESVTKSFEFTVAYLSTFRFRLEATGQTASVSIGERSLAVDDVYRHPRNLQLEVTSIELLDRYTYSEGGYDYTAEPSRDSFVRLQVSVGNLAKDPRWAPRYNIWGVAALSNLFTPVVPYTAPGKYSGGRIKSLESTAGWVLFDVPKGVTRQNLRAFYKDTYQGNKIRVFWSV